MMQLLLKTVVLGVFLITSQAFAGGPGKRQGGAKNPVELPELNVKPEAPKVYRPAEKRVWDLLHTELHLKPNFQTRQLTGRAVLLLTPYNLPQNKLVLDAVNFSDVKVGIWSKGVKIP